MDVAVLVLCAMLVIALAVKVFPVYIQKQQLDTLPPSSSGRPKLPDRWAVKPVVGSSSCGKKPGFLSQRGVV